MGKEIERKFLTKSSEWRNLGIRKFYRQGYLLIDKNRTIRVRIAEDKAFITIKSIPIDFSRNEFQYQIPLDDANQIINTLCEKPIIEKYRTSIKINELIWEVDEFLGDNAGLVFAEVELKDEKQKIDLPDWIGKEVTFDYRYSNSNLVKHPFKDW